MTSHSPRPRWKRWATAAGAFLIAAGGLIALPRDVIDFAELVGLGGEPTSEPGPGDLSPITVTMTPTVSPLPPSSSRRTTSPSSSSSSSSRSSSSSSRSSSTSPAGAPDLSGTWIGTYTCGLTDSRMSLVLTPVKDGRFAATFTFNTIPGRSTVAVGKVAMTGSRTPYGFALSFSRWLQPVPGFFIPDMIADNQNIGPNRISGRLTASDCRSFAVEKKSGEWSYP